VTPAPGEADPPVDDHPDTSDDTGDGPADGPPPAGGRSGRQAALIAGGRVGAAVLSALWLAVAARELTLDDFSDVALVLALGSTLFFLADAGYSTLLSAHVAKVGAIQPAAVVDAVRRRLAGSVLACGLLVLGYWVAANDRSLVVPLLFAGSLAGNAVHGSITAAMRAMGRAGVEAANEVVSRLGVLALGAWLLFHDGGIQAAVLTYAAGDLASAVVLTVVCRRWVRRHASPAGPLPDLRWRKALPIAIASGFVTVYGRVDTWLVALLAPGGTAGLYAAAYRLTEALKLPAQAMGAVALVDASRAGDDAGSHLARQRALRAIALVTVPAVILFVGAGPILRLAFGEAFGAASGMLRILAVSALASSVVAVLGPYIAVRAGVRYAWAVGTVAVINVGANVALVPGLGGQGAAWSNAVGEALLAVLLLRALSGPAARSEVGDAVAADQAVGEPGLSNT
jgi:O-antigen/teichoic acid export membrane protein